MATPMTTAIAVPALAPVDMEGEGVEVEVDWLERTLNVGEGVGSSNTVVGNERVVPRVGREVHAVFSAERTDEC
jgi:hypothetical protein